MIIILVVALCVTFISHPILMTLGYMVGGLSTLTTALQCGAFKRLLTIRKNEKAERSTVSWMIEMFLTMMFCWIIIDINQMIESINAHYGTINEKIRSSQDQED